MTISSQTREVEATGNGIATSFPYGFIVPDEAYLYVYTEVIATGEETEVSASDYTVTGIGDANGGAVEYPLVGSPLAATHKLIIRRIVDYVQEVDISTQTGFNAAVVEAQLDLMVMMIQQLAQGSDTALAQVLDALADAEAEADAAAASATTATTQASSAASSASAASTSASAAAASATAALTSENNAETAETNAAATLATMIAGFTATSVTSQDPSTTGSKTWVTQAGKAYQIGQRLRLASDDGTKVQEGVVTAYSGTSLTVLVDYNAGSAGAHTDWNISITGERGPSGPSGAGTGDVVGPASAVDSHVVLFDGASGKLIKSAGALFSSLATTASVTAAIDALKNGVAAAGDTLAELYTLITTLTGRTLTAGAGLTGGGTLASDRTFTVGAGTGITVNADDVAISSIVARLDSLSQAITGGFRITNTTPGHPTNGSTYSWDPGAGQIQYVENAVAAWTLSPASQGGMGTVWIYNVTGAGTITKTGWTASDGDDFDTTVGSLFLCSCFRLSAGSSSYLNVKKII